MNNKKIWFIAMPKATRKKTISSSWPPIIFQQIILDFMFKKKKEIVYIHTHIYAHINIPNSSYTHTYITYSYTHTLIPARAPKHPRIHEPTNT